MVPFSKLWKSYQAPVHISYPTGSNLYLRYFSYDFNKTYALLQFYRKQYYYLDIHESAWTPSCLTTVASRLKNKIKMYSILILNHKFISKVSSISIESCGYNTIWYSISYGGHLGCHTVWWQLLKSTIRNCATSTFLFLNRKKHR